MPVEDPVFSGDQVRHDQLADINVVVYNTQQVIRVFSVQEGVSEP